MFWHLLSLSYIIYSLIHFLKLKHFSSQSNSYLLSTVFQRITNSKVLSNYYVYLTSHSFLIILCLIYHLFTSCFTFLFLCLMKIKIFCNNSYSAMNRGRLRNWEELGLHVVHREMKVLEFLTNTSDICKSISWRTFVHHHNYLSC